MRFCSKFRFKNETIFAFHTLKSYLGIWNVNVHTPMTSHAFQLWTSIFQTNSVTAFCVLFSIDYLEGLGVELLLESYIFVYQIVQIFHFRLWDSSCHNHFNKITTRSQLYLTFHDFFKATCNFPWLSIMPGNKNKIPLLSRFSTTCGNPDTS